MKITIPKKTTPVVIPSKKTTPVAIKATPAKVSPKVAAIKTVATPTIKKAVKKTTPVDSGLIKGANIGDLVYGVSNRGDVVTAIVNGVDFDLSGETPVMRENWFAILAIDPNSPDYGRIYTYPSDLLYRSDAKSLAMKAAASIRQAREAKRRAKQAASVAASVAAARGESDEVTEADAE